MAGRISQFLSALRSGLVSDVPPEYQACESCRETFCDSVKAEHCLDRRCGEQQERSRRFDTPSRSGTHAIGTDAAMTYDVAASRLAMPPSSGIRQRSSGEYSHSGGEEVVVPTRRSGSNTG